LTRSDSKQTGGSIERPAGELLIFVKGVGSNENEGSSYDVTVSQYYSYRHFLADAPVSTIPAVAARTRVVPYVMDSSIPQYMFAGEVEVMGLCNSNLSDL